MASGDFTRINSNIAAMNSLNSLRNINTKLGVHQMRLATGKRINEAAEDPAGLTIATKFRYRSSGLGVALDNIGDAKNLLAVAEGGLAKINDILIVMRDKTLQAASDALGSAERDAIKAQLDSYAKQIDNIVDETKWNNNQLLDGMATFKSYDDLGAEVTGVMTFQTGADSNEITTFTLKEFDATGAELFDGKHDSTSLGVDSLDVSIHGTPGDYSDPDPLNHTPGTGATGALETLDAAIAKVSKSLSSIGALSARLTFKEETLSVARVNTEAAFNRIMNADMASEQLEATKLQILQQTATAMLAQANMAPQSVLSLFR